MRNRAALNLKYVIWGQKIWSPTTDGAEKSWTNWRTMDNRGDLTQNHWYEPPLNPKPHAEINTGI